jgi:hypothetical protein
MRRARADAQILKNSSTRQPVRQANVDLFSGIGHPTVRRLPPLAQGAPDEAPYLVGARLTEADIRLLTEASAVVTKKRSHTPLARYMRQYVRQYGKMAGSMLSCGASICSARMRN